MADYSYDAGRIAPVSGHFQRGGHRYDGGYGDDYGVQDHGAAAQVRAVSMTNLLGAVASLALVVGVGIWGYGVMARDVSGVPVVRAASGPALPSRRGVTSPQCPFTKRTRGCPGRDAWNASSS